jgi:hypothetical protein
VDTANATYIVDITVEVSQLNVIFDGSVTLEDGTFTFVPSNNVSNSYEVENLTDMGALNTASNEGGFSYNASDEYYQNFSSFYLTDINGITDDAGASTAWFIYVNDELAPLGLSQNEVEDGDQVTFLYAPYEYIAEEPYIIVDTANATYIVDITVEVSQLNVIFDGSVTLEDGTFTFVPSNNASNSYEVENLTDMGALNTASNEGGFTYNASDEYYQNFSSFYLTDINGITDDAGASTAWFIYVNDELAPLGLSQNVVEDGDQVTFLYAPYEYIAEEPYIIVDTANATYSVDIAVEVEDVYTAIDDLKEYIDSLDAPQCTKCILNLRLDGVIHSLERGREQIAIIKLRSFKRAVERHERWDNLSPEEADYIINEADRIIDTIQN